MSPLPLGCMLGLWWASPRCFAIVSKHCDQLSEMSTLDLHKQPLVLLLLPFSACLSCWYQQSDRLLSQTAYRLRADSRCWLDWVIITLLITSFISEEDTGSTEVLPCLFVAWIYTLALCQKPHFLFDLMTWPACVFHQISVGIPFNFSRQQKWQPLFMELYTCDLFLFAGLIVRQYKRRKQTKMRT